MSLPSGNVQETLFVPLWGRSFVSNYYPNLLFDLESVRIAEESGYDFSGIKQSGEYYNLASAVRAANFDREIEDYLAVHPEASIVNIGSGLDTTFFRVDNGKLRWYDIDLPEIIELRHKFVRQNERAVPIAKSCFDYRWMDDVDYDSKKGLIFIVGGVFYYFKEEQVRSFICAIVARFSGAQIVFDAVTARGLKISNRYVKKTGNEGAEMYFSVDNSSRYFASVSPKVNVAADYAFYSRIEINPEWELKTRLSMRFSDFFNMVKLIRLEF